MLALRVAFIITGLGVGGAERQVIDLSRELNDRGHEVLVVTLIEPTEWGNDAIGEAATIETLHMSRGRPNPRAVVRLRSVLETWQPDIVHSHMIHANLLTRIALVKTNWPVVNTIHNVREGGPVLEFAQARTRHIPDWTTLVSQAALRLQSNAGLVNDARTSVLYNGSSFARSLPDAESLCVPQGVGSTKSPFAWLAIGRLEPQKDYGHLLAAVASLRDSGYELRLTIAGTGYLEGELRERIRSLRLDSTVDMVGHVDDIAASLRSSDAVVSSSALEGLPISLIEASAQGLPIVATDVGGTREIVIAGHNGILVDKADRNGLIAGMAKLMDLGPDARRAMGNAGAEHARSSFDIKPIVDEWLNLYDALLTERRRIRPGKGRSG